MTFPIVITTAGLQPTPPQTIRDTLVADVAAVNPGYTANLPGSLIEDVASTDVGAIILCDQAKVDLVNSLTPYGANAFLLNQLGQVYGVPQGTATNTSVYVVFSGPPGFVIAKGFTVSDGTYQYVIQDGGVIGSGSVSTNLFCLATIPGTWSVVANSVTQFITSVPSTITLTVTNPEAGTPGQGSQTEEDYRVQVLQAGLAASTGMSRYLKTLLENVSGVQPRLVSVRLNQISQWEIICGGGDPYQVAYAIYSAIFDVATLAGSVMAVSNITKANPGVVTAVLNHGLTTGQTATITGVVGMTGVNGVPYTITALTEKTFRIGDTSGFSSYVSGGVVSPNPRNITVTITDYPDSYNIPFVNPPQQAVTMTVTWNTSIANFTQQAAVSALGGPALVNYVNSIAVGAPMNLFEMQTVFQAAISSVIPPAFLTRMVFAVAINGVPTAVDSGTGIIEGDNESYFEAAANAVTFAQG